MIYEFVFALLCLLSGVMPEASYNAFQARIRRSLISN